MERTADGSLGKKKQNNANDAVRRFTADKYTIKQLLSHKMWPGREDSRCQVLSTNYDLPPPHDDKRTEQKRASFTKRRNTSTKDSSGSMQTRETE